MGKSKQVGGHAFISYAHDDSVEVVKLQRALEAAGVSVWRDRSSLWPSDDWRDVIQQAITRNALVFIACFSQQSVARPWSYQDEEISLAIEQLRKRKWRRRRGVSWFIPVRLDDCVIPGRSIGRDRNLASLHSSDLFGSQREESLSRLTARVLGLLDHVPKPVWKRTGPRAAVAAVLALALTASLVLAFYPRNQARLALTIPVPGGDSVSDVTYRPDGKVLAAAGAHGVIYEWQAGSKKRACSPVNADKRTVKSISFSADSTLLASVDGSAYVYIWSCNQLVAKLKDRAGADVQSVSFSSDNHYLAISDDRGNVYVWKTGSDTPFSSMSDPGAQLNFVTFNGISADDTTDTLLVSGDASGYVDFWNKKPHPVKQLPAPSGASVQAVTFSADGTLLYAGDADGNVYECQCKAPDGPVETTPLTPVLTGQQGGGVVSLAVDPRGGAVAVAHADGQIDLGTNHVTQVLTDPAGTGIRSVAFSSTGYLAVGGTNGYVYEWTVPS